MSGGGNGMLCCQRKLSKIIIWDSNWTISDETEHLSSFSVSWQTLEKEGLSLDWTVNYNWWLMIAVARANQCKCTIFICKHQDEAEEADIFLLDQD